MDFSRSIKGAAIITAASVVGISHAQVANGSFENGAVNNGTTIASWTTIGDAFLSNATIFTAPTSGAYDATLATQTDGANNERAGVGVTASAAESFLGLASGALQGVGNGSVANVSAIAQTVHLNVGDILRFDYDFLTNEVYNDHTAADAAVAFRPDANHDDFSFLSLARVGGAASVFKLQDVFYGYVNVNPTQPDGFFTGFKPTASTNPFVSETGYLAYVLPIAIAGDYKIGFGVTDAYRGTIDQGINSGLLVDNVRVQSVPEPTTLAALGLGILGVARRRRKTA